MQWEHMTSGALKDATTEPGVCLFAIGSMERHGEHMAVGIDTFFAHKVACLAAEKEAMVVFPPFFYGQVNEAHAWSGAIQLKPRLLVRLILGLLDEIGRNGFRKIILFGAHGGNGPLQQTVQLALLQERKPYCLYSCGWASARNNPDWPNALETKHHGHACECETSFSMWTHPHLVKMEKVPAEPAPPLNRLAHLPPTHTGVSFYADYPDFWIGKPAAATPQKGETLARLLIDGVAQFAAAVKADTAGPRLTSEFYRRLA